MLAIRKVKILWDPVVGVAVQVEWTAGNAQRAVPLHAKRAGAQARMQVVTLATLVKVATGRRAQSALEVAGLLVGCVTEVAALSAE